MREKVLSRKGLPYRLVDRFWKLLERVFQKKWSSQKGTREEPDGDQPLVGEFSVEFPESAKKPVFSMFSAEC